jgi:ketosteroid isomerase-like protein
MKKYLSLFAVLILIAGTSCKEKIDIEKEKAAIMAVINAESETAMKGDVTGLASCYVQDEYNTRLMVSDSSYEILTGWEKLGPFFDQFKANAEADNSSLSFSKENAIIKVTGNTAWAICDNQWTIKLEEGDRRFESIQVTFLEKVDGAWKFSFAAWIPKPEPEVAAPEPEAAK